MIGPDFDHFCRLVAERSGLVLGPEKAYLLKGRLESIVRAEGLADVAQLLARIKAAPAPALIDKCVNALAQALLGFCVRNPCQARSVEEAVRLLEHDQFDLIVVDGEMPEHDGFDLAGHIRGNSGNPNFTVPIILLSNFTPRQKVMRARDAGVNVVIAKPIVPAVILGRIEWLARHPRQFVTSDGYCGPDRRFKTVPLPEGIAERRADAMRLMAQPERDMSQNEIDSIFG